MNIARRAGNVVLWLVLAAVAALAAVMVLIPRVMGWVPLTILTGSMDPTIPAGSQVVVATVDGEADAARLNIGDVITFMPYPDDPTLVTHRVVARTLSTDGTISFTTQGDANNAPDEWTLTATQIRGVVEYHVPYAGYLATALDGSQKQTGVAVVAAALLAYAAVQLLGALRHHRRPAPAAAAVVDGAATAAADMAVVATVGAPTSGGAAPAVTTSDDDTPATTRPDGVPALAGTVDRDAGARTSGPRPRPERTSTRELADAA
ncbi:signal peptidase I [Georgenia thermotolerans]|uniref:Signal peptidase I n=1 Tax=Georgenia thermotolerans TaxID=527326 RepID=A0A7J5UPN6_9MICO|nr:signal peptidase I [Georgenia thermotolerans]KAE8764180.1 signal peptidase I [Georgenia thermotolerans]